MRWAPGEHPRWACLCTALLRVATFLAATCSIGNSQPGVFQNQYDCYREFSECGSKWTAERKDYCFHLLGVMCEDATGSDKDPESLASGDAGSSNVFDRIKNAVFGSWVRGSKANRGADDATGTANRGADDATGSRQKASGDAVGRKGHREHGHIRQTTLPPPTATQRSVTTTPVGRGVTTPRQPSPSRAHRGTAQTPPPSSGTDDGDSTNTLPPSSATAPPQPRREEQQLSRAPWTHDPAAMQRCGNRFRAPVPDGATDLNGIYLPPVCFTTTDGPHHVYVIGDWGGISPEEGMIPVPADHRSPKFKAHRRPFVLGADNCAQLNVAEQMMLRAARNPPDYVINCGDNFYWGGVNTRCGGPVTGCSDKDGQWERIFERIYRGSGLETAQWLGVLGNHDFGGWTFANGWDQTVSYTWMSGGASSGRWFTPALYWGQQVRYREFIVDYFFVDTNVFDAFDPKVNHNHNICSRINNPKNASCGNMGPMNVSDCPFWFQRLWSAQAAWLEKGLNMSLAAWQIVVTHFPPELGEHHWRKLSYKYGIDLIITGHRHQQEVHHLPGENFLSPTAYIVSGGGGGITSESLPTAEGNDDQYGFMDLMLTKEEIIIEALSHGGALRKRACVPRRLPRKNVGEAVAKSLCEGLAEGPLPAPPRNHTSKGKFFTPDTKFFFDAARKKKEQVV